MATISILTNTTFCSLCGAKCCGMFAMWNHVKNNHPRDKLPVKCKCFKLVTDLRDHEQTCIFHAKQQCETCGLVFKNWDKKQNHFRNSKCEPVKAQGFGNATEQELRDLCRHNNHRRRITMNLILHTDFYSQNSLLRRLQLPCWPAFKQTQPARQMRSFILKDQTRVIINVRDDKASDLWHRLEPYVDHSAIAKAQIGFSIDHKMVLDENVSRFFGTITQGLERMNIEESLAQKVLSILIKLIYAARMDLTDPLLLIAWITDVLMSMGVAKMVKDLVLNRVRQFMDSVFAQSSFGLTNLFSPLITVLSSIFFGKIPNLDFIAKLTKLGNVSRGVLSIWSLLDKIFVKCFPALYQHFNGIPYEVQQLEGTMADIKAWYLDVQRYCSLDLDSDIARDAEVCREVERLYKQGLKYSVTANELRLEPKMITALNVHFGAIKRVFDKVERSGALVGGPRMEPIVIQLYGASGVGKTHMMNPLAIELLKVKGIRDPEKWNQEIYNRMPEQDYWDNYFNQRICIYDDFGQKADSESNPDPEYFEIIRSGNIAAYPLHMAALIEKNKTYFTSEAIILTTNVKKISPKSVCYPEAVRRRVDLAVEVLVKPQYADAAGRIDPRKVGPEFRTDIYQFQVLDPMSGTRTDDPLIEYERFMRECVRIYRHKIFQSQRILDYYTKLAAAPPIAQSNNDDKDIKLRQRIYKMDDMQIKELVLGLDQYGDFITEECREAIYTFNPVNNEMGIWDTWRDFLFENMEVRPGGFDFIEQIQREKMADLSPLGLPLDAIGPQRFFFGLDISEEVPVTVQDLRSWRDNFTMENLKSAAESFSDTLKSYFEKVRQFARAHPFFVTFLSLWPIVYLIISEKRRYDEKKEALKHYEEMDDDTLSHLFTPILGDPIASEKCDKCDFVRMIYEDESGKVWGPCRCYQAKYVMYEALDHEHKGLRRGIRVTHKHKCEDCDKEFSHTHKIKSKEESETYPQKCKECLQAFDKRIALEYSLTKKSVEQVIGEMKDSDLPMYEKFALIELASSGDPKTKNLNRDKRVQIMTELATSGDPRTRNVTKERRVQYQAEFMRDNMSFNIGMKLLSNIYNLSFYEGNRQFASLRGFFLRGRIFMTVQHALTAIAKSTHIVIWNNDKPDGFKVPVEDLQVMKVTGTDGEFKDQLLIEMPRSVQIHADIVDSICSSEEMSRFTETNGVLLTPYRKGVVQRHGIIKARDTPLDYAENPGASPVLTLRHSYYYHLETKDGDCGSPLLVVNSQIQRKICGMHVAGNYGGGFATAFNRDDIVATMNKFDASSRVVLNVEGVAQCCNIKELEIPEGNFTPLGKSEYRVGSSSKTKLRPSMVSGDVVAPTTAPARLGPFLKDGKQFDPTLEGLKKCGTISPPLDKKLLAIAVNDVRQNFIEDPVRQRILTNMESVVGIEGDEFATPITRSTSAGYPFRFQTKMKGKTEWLGTDEEYKLDPKIEALMEERIQKAREGERYPTIWIDTLKDERRPHEKVAVGKTRVFSAGPMDFTLTFRKYFLGFLSSVSRHRNDNEVSVGTNVYSPDWTNIALILSSKGKKVVAGDFSNFDGTLHIDILWSILDIINDWYDNEEDGQIRKILWCEIVNSIHVCRQSVYMWTHSQPSGCPATAVLNSIYNSIACRYVYLLLTQNTDYATMAQFRKHVSMVAYGDDNVLNISDEISEIFNQCTMAEAFETFGMKYTDEVKSGKMVPYRTLKDVNYLKRWFVKQEDGQYLAPMEINNILEIGNWIRECPDHKEATIENVQNLCFELSLHGREIFNYWAVKYRRACNKRGIQVRILTFDEYRFTEMVKYGRITAKTEWEVHEEIPLMQSHKEASPKSTGAVTFWELCDSSKARFDEVEWRAQSSIAKCVPLKIQAISPPTFEGKSNPTSGVCKNERIAASKDNENLEQQQITRFVDDVTRTEYVKPGIQAAEEWIKFGSETMDHTIQSVLQRPVEVFNGEFTNNPFTTLKLKFPDIIIQSSPNVVDKLNKFEFLRADIKIKLIFNATPFQQGKYWLFFSPFDDVCGRPATGTLQNATGYPGVEIDLASSAPVELTIPYCSPMSHYRLTNEESTMGELVLQSIVNLDSGTIPTQVSFTIMAWFDNVRTSMPTHSNVSIPTPFRAQMAMDEEEMQTQQGTISALGEQVAVSASAVGRALPALSDITTPVSWVARAISGVASTFGFNKPTTVADTHPYVNHPGRGYTNMDGLDNSHKLAACPDNKLTTDLSYFSSTFDEMDIDYIKKKSCIVRPALTWSLTSTKGSNIMTFGNFPGATEANPSGEVQATTLNFLASMFKYWRGSIRYRLAFAKTAFHTGRLRISFIPSGTTVADAPTGGEAAQLHNWILDLSQSSELEFEIPYVSNTPWTEVKLDSSASSTTNTSRFSTGYIRVEVLTELKRSSPSVASTLTGQLWHCGGEDFELAVPEFSAAIVDDTANFRFGLPNPPPINGLPKESASFVDDIDDLKDKARGFVTDDGIRVEAVAQIFNETGAAVEHRDQEAAPATRMFPASTEQECLAEQMTMGEKVSNLRQVIKRFGEYQRGKPYPYRQATQYMPVGPYNPGSATNDGFFFNSIVIDPAYFGEKNLGNTPVPITASLPSAIDASGIGITPEVTTIGEKLPTIAPIHYISYLYRFWRGSRRYKMFMPAETVPNGAVFRVGTSTTDGIATHTQRFNHPVIVKRQAFTTRNGIIAGTVYNSLVSGQLESRPTFETTIFPDLAGCVEFEVPYYSPLPISVVGEGTLGDEVGPLVVRNKVNVLVGQDTEALDIPAYEFDGTNQYPIAPRAYRRSLGNFRLMTAAGDDFSFGYMVGAPVLRAS